MKRLIYLIILLIPFSFLHAQYVGGDGDGFVQVGWASVFNIYKGADKDGFVFQKWSGDNFVYQGGLKDGFAILNYQNNQPYIYQADDRDGFAQIRINASDLNTYQGASDDGFAFGNLFEKYTWTGALGTGWNVAGNWSTNLTPTIRHQAIIPEGVPNYPMINAGIFAIGKNPNDGLFTCAELLVKKNAELTTRVNCFVENYGYLEIRGTMTVKNPDSNAFKVLSGSELMINNLGTLIFQE